MRGGGVVSPFTTLGSGSNTVGYWLGGPTSNKLIVAPQSTEVSLTWGSWASLRGATNQSDGLSNTNTLAAFGQASHPAAYYCKNLSTGGYNTWYMPAINELGTLYANKSATPFATSDGLPGSNYLASTEVNSYYVWIYAMSAGYPYGVDYPKNGSLPVRAVRRTDI